MTFVGICRSCGKEFGKPFEVFLHRGRCAMNPVIDVYVVQPPTGIEKAILEEKVVVIDERTGS